MRGCFCCKSADWGRAAGQTRGRQGARARPLFAPSAVLAKFNAPREPETMMSATNGGPQPQPAMPQIGVLAQYVKDFSFENPNAPRSMAPSGQQPTINIQVNVDAAPMTTRRISR